jgi:UDP-N-acetylmuramoyl-L-alanyl-D-glutamate--2,6-diaminopimelate ligase
MIADRFVGSSSADIETFGITGTHGKTSVAHALARVLAVELPCGIVGTIGTGFPGDLKAIAEQGSDPLDIRDRLEDLRSRGARAVALEVGFAAIARTRAAGVCFSHAVFTGLSRDFGDASAWTDETILSLFGSPGLRWAVVNLDDPFSETILAAVPSGVRIAGIGVSPAPAVADRALLARCDLRLYARDIRHLPRGLRLGVLCEGASGCAEATLEVGLIGAFNAANLLAVLAVLLSRGLPLERAARELSGIRGAPGRMECFGGERTPLILVDEARTPTALEAALRSLGAHRPRRVFTVFGCRGEDDPRMRPRMGAVAERLSDGVILTDDNPRSACGDAIIADILAGMADPSAVRVERQRGLAIRTAMTLAGTGDAVLVAGKGHETSQDMGSLKVRFSDRAQVVEALRELREGHH